MEGTNETSNAKFQARTSYLPQGEGLLDVLISKLITLHSIALHYRDPVGPQIWVHADLQARPEQISGQLLCLPLQLRGGYPDPVRQAAVQDHGLLRPSRDEQHEQRVQQLPELLPPLHSQQEEADQEAAADRPRGSQQPPGGSLFTLAEVIKYTVLQLTRHCTKHIYL